jgi:uncharacterized protein
MPTALITGGTSGIGAAFARALADRGYALVIVARDAERLRSTAEELSGVSGHEVEVIAADLADERGLAAVERRVRDGVDLLVNNAGFGIHSSLVGPDVAVFDRAFDVMGRAVLVLSGAAAEVMRARGHGGIVNVSSTAGYITTGAYSALKSWVTVYTEALANELHGSGVRVMALLPGWVRTEFHARAGIRASSIPSQLWLEADELVADALRDLERGRVLSIPSVRYRALMWFARHAPRRTVRWASRAISSSRRDAAA